ncbi:GDP-mannose 4,6-dehydratase [Candidatus Pelagibacter sp.]|nr:GDP-mannose 4,6-dehydratase [Candidatus Pelagibacter sp.]
MKSKIFITGAAGFIGFHSAKKFLEKGIKVHGFDCINKYYDIKLKKTRLEILKKYKNFTFTKANLENEKKLFECIIKFKPQIIIHLAAQAGVRYSIKNPETYLNSNILGTFNVLKAANKIKIKHLIIGSSSSVYGANKKFPFQEIDKTDHQVSFYAATKKSTESLAHSYSSLWKLPTTILRFFTVYGPYGRPDMAYFSFTNKILAGKTIEIFNKGKMYRDYTYINDIVDGIYKLLNKAPTLKSKKKFKNDSLSPVAPFRILNIGNTKKVYLLDFINTLEKELNKKIKRKYLPMQKGDVHSTLSDSSLLKRITGYNPKTNYKIGIKKFINWYTNYYR